MNANRLVLSRSTALLLGLIAVVPLSCKGDSGEKGAPGTSVQPPPIPTQRTRDEGLPGLDVTIVSVKRAGKSNDHFQVGNHIAVRYTVELDDGTPVPLDQLDSGGILVSGPTNHYQPVLARQTDLRTRSKKNKDGSWTYTFEDPIPATYLPPLNDSPAFGPDDGEWQGMPLVDGTYTVGIEAYKNYVIEGQTYRDADNALADFLFGDAQTIDTRAVVSQENCNQCHEDLQAHGSIRHEVRYCLLCHTAGAEDKNVASAAGGTPGRTIDFRVMIHKIHNGGHLPSVLGVGVMSDGSRDYTVPPQPYELVGFGNNVIGFSEVTFPVWPNLNEGLPKDVGYESLSSTAQAKEDAILTGAATCEVCHGDPDQGGPLVAPAEGQLAYTQPSRLACGSCHDDIDWTLPYISNMLRMPPQPTDNVCTQCHPATGSPLAVTEGHLHPLKDPALQPGLMFYADAVREGGNADGDGTIDPGEKVLVDYRIEDKNGQSVDPSTLARMEFALAGPTVNRNILAEGTFPTAYLSAGSGTTTLPETVWLENVGSSSSATGEMFTTARAPHWNVSGALTSVMLATNDETSTSVAADAEAYDNELDVMDASGFSRGDYVGVYDSGMTTFEVLRVQWVEGNRLWFSSIHSPYSQPWLRSDHSTGDVVQKLLLTAQVEGTDYDLDESTGTITEIGDIGTGTVVVTYTTDYELPAMFPGAINDSPDLGRTAGQWTGLSIVDGTYTVALWGEQTFDVTVAGTTTSYSAPSQAGTSDFLVGDASTLNHPMVVSSAQNCYDCHQDIYFHGGHRRGYETCTMCHTTSGAEDRPRYVAPNAPATTGLTIDFRSMLHKIHRGAELANASSYEVIGFGSGYPNNYSINTYEEVHFPALPGGTAECTSCHGQGNTAFEVPMDREHPQQTVPTQSWALACGSCHDSGSAQAHIAVQTAPNGQESCEVCHGQNDELSVERLHRTW